MHCKILLLQQGDAAGAIVTLELPSIRPWELTDQLRQYAAEQLGTPYENTWLVMTHDLSAPHVPQKEELRAMHMAALRKAVKDAAVRAKDTACKAVPRFGESVCRINVNRDMESLDGWWVGVEGDGPSDHTLSLIRFDDLSGKPIAALYSYAIKSSVLEATIMSDGKRYASGDVTGAAGVMAEEALGCPVLFVMGAAGDQVPRQKGNHLILDAERQFVTVNHGEKAYEMLDELAAELAESIQDAYRRAVADANTPALVFRHMALQCPGKLPYPKTLPAPPVLSYTYVPAPEETLDIWAIGVGNCLLIGVKPEIPTPIFTQIKQQNPGHVIMLATLVNGGQGYIATDTDLERFTYPGLNAPFQRGTDRLFEKAVHDITAALTPTDA